MSDLIDRQAAIRWVKTECNPYGKPTLEFESGKKVIEHLEQMPSAQPERKTGVWLEDEDDPESAMTDGYCGYCSVCKEMSEYLTNYCGNCGADMRGTWNEHNRNN